MELKKTNLAAVLFFFFPRDYFLAMFAYRSDSHASTANSSRWANTKINSSKIAATPRTSTLSTVL